MAKKKTRKEGFWAGVDIGGTKIHAVIGRSKGKVLARARKKTRAQEGFDAVLGRVEECLDAACKIAGVARADLAGVGVGAPSPIRPDGVAVNAPNMGWENVPLVKKLSKRLGLPTVAENDCNLGTLGEYRFGAGQGCRSLVGLFVGTGLGGGIVLNGEMIRGENRLAAEVGHMIVAVHGRKCGCAHLGCLEAYASKQGLGHFLRQAIEQEGRDSVLREDADLDFGELRSGTLAEALAAGDAVVKEALAEMCWYLGLGIANLVTLFGPQKIVLGGGVMEAMGEQLLGSIREPMAAHIFPAASVDDVELVLSSLGDDAVALGALAYAVSQLGEKRRGN